MRLSELQRNESGIITKVRGRGAFRKRILEMGFVKGKKVSIIKNAPLQDPIEYSIMGYKVSLRRSEASLIEVITKEEAKKEDPNSFNGVLSESQLKKTAREKQKTINIALVGNPNSGKTTLFNFASRSREHVGNYGGVTVGSKMGRYKQDGYTFNITDLPGTYSMSVYSPEELFVRKHILGEMLDIVINVADASNLERNLYLTTQLIDMDIKVIIALNMYDELKKKGDYFDYQTLGKMVGIPIIPTISSKGVGIHALFQKAIQVFEDEDPTVRHVHINYGQTVEKTIKVIQDEIWKNNRLLTILINPFMSCSARLPVYVLIISAFFPERSGTMLFSVYLFGILMAGLIAVLFKKTLFKTDEIPFVMELPPYRMPTLNNTIKHMWNKGSQYVKKMGGIILVASIIIWALSYYPKNPANKQNLVQKTQSVESLSPGSENTPAKATNPTSPQPGSGKNNVASFNKEKPEPPSEIQKHSYIAQIGEFISPVMKPLGFDWKMSVSLISGIAAKEIVVSTMAVLYQVDSEGEARQALIQRIKQARFEEGSHKGEKVFDQLTALAFLLFILLYFPCVAALAAIKKETGTWKWPAFAMTYTTLLAWIVAFMVQQIGSLIV